MEDTMPKPDPSESQEAFDEAVRAMAEDLVTRLSQERPDPEVAMAGLLEALAILVAIRSRSAVDARAQMKAFGGKGVHLAGLHWRAIQPERVKFLAEAAAAAKAKQ